MKIAYMMERIKDFWFITLLLPLFTSAVDQVILPSGCRLSSQQDGNSGERAYDGQGNTYALTGNDFQPWMLFFFPSTETFKSVEFQGILPPSTEFRCGYDYQPLGRGDTKHGLLKLSTTRRAHELALLDSKMIDLPHCEGNKVLIRNLNGTASIKIKELSFII